VGALLNWKRWLLVGYLLALMAFTTSVLLIPGQRYSGLPEPRPYNTLTTSDSGWFYDIAADIAETHGMVENNRLSHAPYGMSVSLTDQAQPLITVMLHGGVQALDSSVTLMDVVRYWAPLLFALSLIPIFLIGKELGGISGGCAAAFFAAALTSSIYWHKLGAFDREPIQLILGAWTIYLSIKLFKASRSEIPKFALLTGLVCGLFGLSWAGWWYVVAILIGGALFVLWISFLAKLIRGTPGPEAASSTTHEHLSTMVGVVGTLVVITIILWTLGGQSPRLWEGVAKSLWGYAPTIGKVLLGALLIAGSGLFSYLCIKANAKKLGASWFVFAALCTFGIYWLWTSVGAEGVSIARYAGEMAPPDSWGDVAYRMYGSGAAEILTRFVFALVLLALLKVCWSRKRWELLVLPWLIIIAAMVWPGSGQVRFERMWWPFVPVLAGVGAAVLASLVRRLSFEQFGEWLKYFQRPVVIAFCVCVVATTFIFNAYAVAERTTPPTEWHGYGLDEGFMDAFAWLRENTPEDSVVAIEWSFGHVLTGTARRATVADGTELLEEIGKWENAATILPPDYVYSVEDSTGIFLNSHWTINGRRTDVQYLPTLTDDNELAFYFKTYRDNYGVRIDYVIFNRYLYNTAIWATRRGGVQNSTTSGSIQDGKILYTFSDENVFFDPQSGEAYATRDDETLHLAGWVRALFNQRGELQILDYSLRPDPAISRVLWILVPDWVDAPTWDQTQAQLTDPTVYGLPIIMRVFEGRGTMPNFMGVIYTSSNGLVKMVKVYHEPSLISPTDNAATNDNTPTFAWAGAIGAVKYELWVDNDADFSSPEIRENVFTVTHTLPDENALADDTYSWRVRAFRADNTELGWSPTWTFVIDTQVPGSPQLREPGNNVELNTLQTTFAWTEPEPNVTYGIQIDDEVSFAPPYVHDNSGIRENSYTYLFPHNGTYYWRVQAFDRAGNASGWSDNYKLIIRAPLRAPTLSAPADGAITSDNTPTFGWAEGNADNYRLLVDDDTDFLSPEENVLLGITDSYTVADENALPDDNYSWKVIAIVGESRDSSSVWTFVVDTTPPTAAAPHTPENGATTSDNTPTFEWTLGAGATKHRLLVDNDGDFSTPEVDVTLSVPENTHTSSELVVGSYWWKVIAIDDVNNENESSAWTFTVQA